MPPFHHFQPVPVVRPDFAGPLQGRAAADARATLRTMHGLVGGLERLDVLRLHRAGRLTGCTRTARKTWPRGRPAGRAFSRRDELLLLRARYAPAPEKAATAAGLVPADELVVALKHAEAGNGPGGSHPAPWELRRD